MSEHCPICDDKRFELQERHDRRLLDLWGDFHRRLATLAEAHAEGEHDGVEIIYQSEGESITLGNRAVLENVVIVDVEADDA